MPGAGQSESSAVRAIGAIIGLIAVIGYLIFDWSFNDSESTITTALGIIVGVLAIGWTLYNRVSLGERL